MIEERKAKEKEMEEIALAEEAMAEKAGKTKFADLESAYTPKERRSDAARRALNLPELGPFVGPAQPEDPDQTFAARARRALNIDPPLQKPVEITTPTVDASAPKVTEGPFAPQIQRQAPAVVAPAKGIGEYADELKNYMGVDPSLAKREAQLTKMNERAQKASDQAPWLALAEAGFSIAAGESPYALTNIASGALKGIKSYGDLKDKIDLMEDKRLALENDLAKQERAEKLAFAKYGAESMQAGIAAQRTEALLDKKIRAEKQINDAKIAADLLIAGAKGGLDTEATLERLDALRTSPQYRESMKAFVADKGKNKGPGTIEYETYSDNILKQMMSNDLSIASNIRGGGTAGSTTVGGKTFTSGKVIR